MKRFTQHVDLRSRAAMIAFLRTHSRYSTMNKHLLRKQPQDPHAGFPGGGDGQGVGDARLQRSAVGH
ncbi:hypothetical protein PDESU_00951 [Pontiella desulfatans]|uniref:Uncharacterized protein n=1 Tax=Pontiella desulfatans TaxID=2750659 RepID=A0A6C2TXT2_PONDE|nr:hypothetical protein [Pontiella desulfatans]VGO12399.1 hypothetical protein PDESU_00951 [Pontiella desulfatans]